MDWCWMYLNFVASEYIFPNTTVVVFYTCLHTGYTHISCNNHGFLVPPDVFVTCCPLYPSTICAKYGQIYKDKYLTCIIL
jgi:hypothetical protein